MSRPLNILFVSSEVEPFAKTGGLADVASALPQAVKDLGHEIRIIMPKYKSVEERKFRLHEVLRLKEIDIPIGQENEKASVRSCILANTRAKIQVYFLANESLYNRSGLYVNSETQKDYEDNDKRFIFFCRGVLETLRRLGWQPDIIHCNDWQTGLIPAYVKTTYRSDPFFSRVKTIFTIHNMAFQGSFPRSSFLKTHLPEGLFPPDGVEFYGNLNFLKSALVYADIITTVSEKYALEIRSSDEYGCGMSGILQKRKSDLYGILNGIDYSTWNPEIDNLIPQKYDVRNLDGKSTNKIELLRKFKLEYREGTPVIGCISRLSEQKGFDLIGQIADDFLKLDVQFVLLGTGEKKYHDLFEAVQKRHPYKVGIHLGFSNELAHLIEAGSDMFLMPSRYEPCGLNQMYSLRYGTIPIVRATGGLDDTIEDYDSESGNGTGFKFSRYDATELLGTIERSINVYANKVIWRKMMKQAMQKDFSWESSAKKYIALYKNVLKH
jgi:starch synthase